MLWRGSNPGPCPRTGSNPFLCKGGYLQVLVARKMYWTSVCLEEEMFTSVLGRERERRVIAHTHTRMCNKTRQLCSPIVKSEQILTEFSRWGDLGRESGKTSLASSLPFGVVRGRRSPLVIIRRLDLTCKSNLSGLCNFVNIRVDRS